MVQLLSYTLRAHFWITVYVCRLTGFYGRGRVLMWVWVFLGARYCITSHPSYQRKRCCRVCGKKINQCDQPQATSSSSAANKCAQIWWIWTQTEESDHKVSSEFNLWWWFLIPRCRTCCTFREPCVISSCYRSAWRSAWHRPRIEINEQLLFIVGMKPLSNSSFRSLQHMVLNSVEFKIQRLRLEKRCSQGLQQFYDSNISLLFCRVASTQAWKCCS